MPFSKSVSEYIFFEMNKLMRWPHLHGTCSQERHVRTKANSKTTLTYLTCSCYYTFHHNHLRTKENYYQIPRSSQLVKYILIKSRNNYNLQIALMAEHIA